MAAWSASETLTGVSSISLLGPKGKRSNAYMSEKISEKRLMNAPKLNLKEIKKGGLSTHCHNNETSFNTHRARGIHSGRRRSMEKSALYLEQKKKIKNFWIAHRAISLGATVDWCSLINRKMPHCVLSWKQIVSWGTNGQSKLTKYNTGKQWFFMLHWTCTCCTLLYTILKDTST